MTIVDNNITTTASNANISLNPNGTGKVEALETLVQQSSRQVAKLAQYADLAEIMQVMLNIPGTVMTVGGDAEITKAPQLPLPAGVISTPTIFNEQCSRWTSTCASWSSRPVVGNITKGMPICKPKWSCKSQNGQGPVEPH